MRTFTTLEDLTAAIGEELGTSDWLTIEQERVDARGLFLLLGAAPECGWLPDTVLRDERGFVLTGRDIPRERWVEDVPPEDLATTIYNQLGIVADKELIAPGPRPIEIVDGGKVRKELLL